MYFVYFNQLLNAKKVYKNLTRLLSVDVRVKAL